MLTGMPTAIFYDIAAGYCFHIAQALFELRLHMILISFEYTAFCRNINPYATIQVSYFLKGPGSKHDSVFPE